VDATPWQAPDPHEVVRFRAEILDSLQTTPVFLSTVVALAGGNGTLHLSSDPTMAAGKLLADETVRLRTARLYSVTKDMTEVAVAAGESLPTWKVLPQDIPASAGLMVFDSPIAVYDTPNYPVPVQIVAASWGPTQYLDDVVWLTFWSMADPKTTLDVSGKPNASDVREFQRMMGPVMWDNEALLSFRSSSVGVSSGPNRRELVDPADPGHRAGRTTLGWVQTVRAAWMIIQRAESQRPIAQVQQTHLSKTVQRAMRREGYEPTPVTVVSLAQRHRHQQPSAGEHASGYSVKVRSLVRPHIRWQPYPSRGTIEPIPIDSYVRGPDGAPFAPRKTKVYRVDG
jgi:hypothetical protein